MTSDENDLLKYGLKFCPTPTQSNSDQLNRDINDFCRKLRLKSFFHNKETFPDMSLVKNKSHFDPGMGGNRDLDTMTSFVQLLCTNSRVDGEICTNLKKNQYRSMNSLKHNTNIIIKEADKGSALVLMNRDYYQNCILNLLNDTTTYIEVSENKDHAVINKIKRLSIKFNNVLTKKEKDYITNFDYKTSQFYGLPKVHKSDQIKNMISSDSGEVISVLNPTDLNFRPIVASTQCPTNRLSELLDKILQPLQIYVKSYIKNTVHFLNKLPLTVKTSDTFITFDVSSLYTNITHDLGLEALNYWMNKYPEILDRFDKEFVLEGLSLVLRNNYFQFNGKNYLQQTGTAMGTRVAPCYANLTLGYLEERLYQKLEDVLGEESKNEITKYYFRYLDDIFCIWNNDLGNYGILFDILQNLDDKLNFTCDQKGRNVNFLDVNVQTNDNRIVTDIFYKITDTKQYLDFRSYHPRHIKNNIPFNLARRICTIVSTKDKIDLRLEELRQNLLACNYPPGIINKGLEMALNIPQNQLREEKKTITNNSDIPFVTTNHPHSNETKNIIYETMKKVKNNESLGKLFDNTRIINAKRQPPNLKQILTNSHFSSTTETFSVSKCGEKKCMMCTQIREGNHFNFGTSRFSIKSDMNCNSRNVVYVLECGGCDKLYIGETNNLRLRINNHRTLSNTGAGLYVNNHFYNCAGKNHPTFKVMPFYKVKRDDTTLRKEKELYFINKFKPLLNRDLLEI